MYQPASSARYCGRRRGFLQLPCIQSSTSAGMLPCTAAASGVACAGMMKWYFRAHTGWCCQPEHSQSDSWFGLVQRSCLDGSLACWLVGRSARR